MKHALFMLAALATILGADAQRIERENIEWLDVWIPHTNAQAALPRVLLIGNSITRGYHREVDKLLNGKAYVARMSTSKSVGDPGLISEIKLVMGYLDFDVVHFNNGLHGAGYTEEEYAAAFPEMVQTIKECAKPGARLIWATTTPVYEHPRQPDYMEKSERVRQRNQIAAEYLKDKGIAINDLFDLCISHPEFYKDADGVHLNPQGYVAMAAQVAREIEKQIKNLEK